MAALDPAFMEQEIDRCLSYGLRSRSDVVRLRYWQDRARAAYAAQPKSAAPIPAGRPNVAAAPIVGGVRETPGRPAAPAQLSLGDAVVDVKGKEAA